MAPIAIRVDGLGKRYHVNARRNIRRRTLQDVCLDIVKRPYRHLRSRRSRAVKQNEAEQSIWALADVSFELREGEALAVIGSNGAGKSTLLKILSRITPPTTGRAEVFGRVGSLLEVGTGFHPELSGRDNVYLNGCILGMDPITIGRRFDEIVDFAGVGAFIDTPVKRYSSGMYLRLAFAIAAHLEPDILLIDEVLAVGDAEFQRKCLGRMSAVGKEGRTVLFVSHNLAAVRQLCRSAILLRDGRLVSSGPTDEILTEYLESTQEAATIAGPNEYGLQLVGASISDEVDGIETTSLVFDRNYQFDVRIQANALFTRGAVVVQIRDHMDSLVSSLCTVEEGLDFLDFDGTINLRFIVPRLRLAPGSYTASVFVYRPNDSTAYLEARNANSFQVCPAIVNNAMWSYRRDHGVVRIADSVSVVRS